MLSVIIPSYNTELYIERCLDSLLYNQDIIDKIEIIVVNDGSKDNTAAIAERYKKLFPQTVIVINKENGGHGSTINAGLAVAQGKYVKVVDSDDWVNIFEFKPFVERLAEINDDLIVTNFTQNILYDGTISDVSFCNKDSESMPVEQIDGIISSDGEHFTLSMHSMTVKTKALKKVWGSGLMENTFYVDMQFVTKVLECTKTFRTLNYTIYMYFIGRPEQSVADFFKRRKNHERVLKWVLSELHSKRVQESEYLSVAIAKLAETMTQTHYEMYYRTLTATRAELQEILEFDTYLMNEYPDLHKSLAVTRNLRRRMSPLRRFIKRKMLVIQ